MPPPSRQLARLQAMARAGAARPPDAGAAHDGADDLAWCGTALAWRRGARTVHTFTFPEAVHAACFAQLARGAHADDAPHTERALCILLERTVHFFLPRRGETYVEPLRGRVAALVPVHVGVLLVGDARAFYVRSVLDDLAQWVQVDAISPAPTLHGTQRALLAEVPGERIVYADAAYPVLVSAGVHTLRFYVYACAAQPITHDAAPRHTPAPPRRASLPRRSSRRRSSAARDADWHVLTELAEPAPSHGERRTSLARRRTTRRSSLPAADREASGAPAAPTPDEPFARLAQAHAAAALVEEIAAPALAHAALAAHVQCTRLATPSGALLYVAVPAARRVYVRALRAGDARSVAAVCAPHAVDRELVADSVRAVALVRPADAPDALLVAHGTHRVLHCGPPAADTAALTLAPDAPVPCVRPACAAARRVLDASATLPRREASALAAAYARACGVGGAEPRRGTWATLAALAGAVWDDDGGSGAGDAYAALCADGSDAFLDAVLGAEHAARARAEARAASVDLRSLALVLHFVALDALLDTHRQRTEAPRVVRLLQHVCARLGWGAWLDFWARRVGGDVPEAADGRGAVDAPDAPDAPPDLYALLHDALRGTPTSLDAAYAACAASLGVGAVARIAPHCAFSAALVDVYAALGRAGAGAGAGEDASRAVLDALLAAGWDAAALARVAPGAALPLYEALRTCQLAPPAGLSAAAYTLLGRLDAGAQARGACAAPARVVPALLRTLPEGLDPLSGQLFARDFRLGEVARLLQTTRANVAHVAHDDERDEAEHHAEVLHVARALAERTMAQCIGRGMFRMASRARRATATWRTPRLCLALRTLPGGGVLAHPYAADPHEVDWPEFHNGVASALEIAVHADAHIDSNWIFAHSAAPRDAARHAGFLLGLGLHGHLARLGRVHAYRYLAPRHALTTVGLVLGVAASFLGSADPAARQVMAVQVAAFLPHRSAALPFAPLTQAAGLLGMGLVFAATDHRWTAERLAAQLDAPLPAHDAPQHDLYANAAGLALGWVLLGRGRRAPMDAASDLALLARLRRLVLAHDAPAPAAHRAAHAATLALALVFLRSGRADLAQLLAPPDSPHALEHVRPDLLLVRTLARALILWDEITPDDAWLLATLAPFMQCMDPAAASLGAAEQVAWYNMRAGACLALSLRFAGTADARARALLLRQLQAHVHDAPPAADTYAARIVHAARATLRDVLHVALATVMAGTGDVELLRLYRIAHGTPARGYASHMAAHTALGLLFLGGGRFSLGTGDVAVAALLTAFLPRYPASPGDCRAHLQAARHLYVLALAPRLLVARDVRSGEVCALPIAAVAADPAPDTPRLAPTLLPPLDTLRAVHSTSRRYWPAALDTRTRAAAAADAREPLWLHVQRRTGYLSYADDPHGHRSIFARSRGAAAHPFSTSTAAEARALLRDLLELVRGFETAPQYAALVTRVCQGGAPVQVFCTAVLLECLTADTPALVHAYLALYDALTRPDALAVDDVRLLLAYYASAADAAVRDGRDALLGRAARASLAARVLHTADDAPLAAGAAAYLGAHGAARLSPDAALALARLDAPPRAALAALRTRFAHAGTPLGTRVLTRVFPERAALVARLAHAWAPALDSHATVH